jgi:hypothetical protein
MQTISWERGMKMKKSNKLAFITMVVLLFAVALLSTGNVTTAMAVAGPTIQSCDEFGNPVDDFDLGTMAFIKGSGFQPNSDYYVIVYDDGICSPGGDDHTGDLTWSEGDLIFRIVDGSARYLWVLPRHTNSLGQLEPTNVVDTVGPMYQCYDVVVTQGDGDISTWQSWTYNSATDALDDNNTCFHGTAGLFVVPEYTLGTLTALVACFGAFFAVKHKSLRLPSIHN